MLRDMPALRERQAFEWVTCLIVFRLLIALCISIRVKQMELSYHVEKVIREDIPRLKHGNDGLIYTCAESPYVVGTDQRMFVPS
jgi:mRNA guanylyltransferase